MAGLLNREALEQSEVVANSAMNRERGCSGPNSYEKELGFSPVEFLAARRRRQQPVAWLDLCCGRGRALIEAARRLAADRRGAALELVGVDLVPMFDPIPREVRCLRLLAASAVEFEPATCFDLVTCVHGLHYVGDKLRLLRQAIAALKGDGRFIAHLDPVNLKFPGAVDAGRPVIAALRRSGVDYNPRKRLLSCGGRSELRLEFEFLGADAAAGPNFTGQPAVDSYYQPLASGRTGRTSRGSTSP